MSLNKHSFNQHYFIVFVVVVDAPAKLLFWRFSRQIIKFLFGLKSCNLTKKSKQTWILFFFTKIIFWQSGFVPTLWGVILK